MAKTLKRLFAGDAITSVGTKAFKKLTKLRAGLYDADGGLVASWDALVNTYGMNITKDFSTSSWETDVTHVTYVLTNTSELADGVKLVVDDTVKKIGNVAFYKCPKIKEILLPHGLKSIGEAAFSQCNALVINLPSTVTTITRAAFMLCNITNITIPNSIDVIYDSTFSMCIKLANITIPDSVTSIDKNAFSSCSKLTDVYYTGTAEQWASITIGDGNEKLTSATIHYNHIATP